MQINFRSLPRAAALTAAAAAAALTLSAAPAQAATTAGTLQPVKCSSVQQEVRFVELTIWTWCYNGTGEIDVSDVHAVDLFSPGSHSGWVSYQDADGAVQKYVFTKGGDYRMLPSRHVLRLHIDS
ncbi:hypothetical protein RMN57_04395 [Kitasatospora sp. CM 4170]|uniref:Secreted protein n=1 Tax=Kitasatospora aburaviensis TaxID=67265 RepID=A0ABW1EVW0_9ACTN|nr:hypothetical protein [Kitasatospora sp. CM 4170]WNM44000.1 hypothetical protein RMN57_04395 [Kitasatospora sp. CM 4170]